MPAPRASAGTAGSALGTVLLFVAVLWAVELVDTVLGGRLDLYGVRPRTDEGLVGVVFAPLLHGSFGHLVANTVPLVVLGFLLLLHGLRRWLQVTAVVWVVGGLGTWLTGAPGSIHIGASSLVFGWLAYLILIGFLNGRVAQILVGVLVLVMYGGLLWGVLPGTAGVSWQGHLFGAVGGLLAAFWLRDRDRPRPTPAPPAWRG